MYSKCISVTFFVSFFMYSMDLHIIYACSGCVKPSAHSSSFRALGKSSKTENLIYIQCRSKSIDCYFRNLHLNSEIDFIRGITLVTNNDIRIKTVIFPG